MTLPRAHGDVVIAFLALFVMFTGSHLWYREPGPTQTLILELVMLTRSRKIICFIIHQSQSTIVDKDGLHHQIQTILPNGLPDISMAWRFSELLWAWRKKTNHVRRRIVPLLLISLVHFAAVTSAGLLASQVADSADEVLIRRSNDCGWYDRDRPYEFFKAQNLTDEEFNFMDSFTISIRLQLIHARQYAMSCYKSRNGQAAPNKSTPCSSYVSQALQSTVNRNATCPFKSRACSAPALSFDSGYVDSHEHLGINAPQSERIQVRRLMTCSAVPLEQEYSLPWSESDPVTGVKSKALTIGYINDNSEDSVPPMVSDTIVMNGPPNGLT